MGVSIITTLAVSVISARLLEPVKYGQLVFFVFLTDAIIIIIGLGFQTNMSINISRLIGLKQNAISSNFVKWNSKNYFMLTFLGLSILLIYLFIFNDFNIDLLSTILIVIYFINKAFSGFFIAFLTGHMEFVLIRKYNQYFGITLFFLLFFGIFYFGFKGALIAYCLSSFVYILFFRSSLLTLFEGVEDIDRNMKKDIIQDSLKIWITLLISLFIWNRLEIIFLEHYWNTKTVAIYNVAMSFGLLISTIPSMLTSTLTNHISHNKEIEGAINVQNIYLTGTKILSAIMIPLSFFTAASLPTVIPFIYGVKYNDSIFVTQILTLNAILQIGVVGSSILMGFKDLKIITLSGLLGVVLSLILLFLFVPIFGITGAAFSKITVQFVVIFVGHYYLNTKLGTKFPFIYFSKILLLTLFFSIPIYFVSLFCNSLLYVAISFVLMSYLYFVSLIKFHIISHKEKSILKKSINNLKFSKL